MPNYSKSEYDDRRAEALARHDALRKEDQQFKREMQGTFEQSIAAKKAMEGDFKQRSNLQREIQGIWDQKAAQERLVQGTFPEREAGLNTRQAAQLQSAMDIARLHDTGAMDRARLAEQGAFDRATLGENAANWRHSTPQAAYHYVPLRGSGDDLLGGGNTGDLAGTSAGTGNGVGGVAVFLNGQRIDQQSRPSLLAQLAPGGLKDANHLISTLNGLPEESRDQFKAEAARAHPDLFKQAYNILSNQKKAQGTGQPSAPATNSAVAAAPPVATPEAPFALPDREQRHSGTSALGGDLAPAAMPTYGRGPYWNRGGPVITPPDTDSYARMVAASPGGSDPYAPMTAPPAPAPSSIRKPMPIPEDRIPVAGSELADVNWPRRPGSMIRQPMPTPGLTFDFQRNNMPGRVMMRKPIRQEEPEFLRQPF